MNLEQKLDEIEQMLAYSDLGFQELDAMFAQMVAFFPELAAILEDLLVQLRSKPDDVDEPSINVETSSSRGLSTVDQPTREESSTVELPEIETIARPEVKEDDEEKFTAKQLFRKISQRCHPDKCRYLDRDVELKLRDCFASCREAYQNGDLQELEFIYIRVCFLRNDLDKIPNYMLFSLECKYNMLNIHIIGLRQHPLFSVYMYKQRGDIDSARALFEDILRERIRQLKSELAN